jgi:hypothetical protein
MNNLSLALMAPTTVNRTARRPNAELRTREHLTVGEIEKLIESASSNRKATAMALWCCLRSGMGCEQRRSVICAGSRSTSLAQPCTSAALSTERLLRIR